jgi:alpha-tubulin suppressor-like RCC1 family protein
VQENKQSVELNLEEDVDMELPKMQRQPTSDMSNSMVKDYACGGDFILTLRGDNNIYSMGGTNKSGQLGTGKLSVNKVSNEFTCVETLLDVSIKSIFAGASQCFAIIDNTNDTMDVFLQTFDKVNQEWKDF